MQLPLQLQDAYAQTRGLLLWHAVIVGQSLQPLVLQGIRALS